MSQQTIAWNDINRIAQKPVYSVIECERSIRHAEDLRYVLLTQISTMTIDIDIYDGENEPWFQRAIEAREVKRKQVHELDRIIARLVRRRGDLEGYNAARIMRERLLESGVDESAVVQAFDYAVMAARDYVPKESADRMNMLEGATPADAMR